MTPRPDPRIIALAHLCENLATRLPIARAHVRDQLNHLGDLRAATYDGTRTTGQTINVDGDAVPVTTVEAAALRKVAMSGRLDDIELDVKGVAMIVANILRDLDKIIGTTLPDTPRCNSTGRDGASEWGGECHKVPSRGPLCDTHAKAEYRWRVRHNLPPRTDGVFSAEAREAS